jgi:replicative DNA helicase
MMPANQEVERSILGSILLNDALYDEASSAGLVAEDFALDSHRRIFRGMYSLAESSRPIDMITLIEELDRHKDLQAIGDVGYVSSLLDGVPDRSSIRHYVRIVKEGAARRKLIHACNATEKGLHDQSTSGDAIEYLTEQILQIQTGSDEAPAYRVIEFSDPAYAEWLRLADSTSDLIGLSTGIGALDLATTGIREGERWVYTGRTGDGKTNLALQTVAENCREGIPVAMFSIEMKKEALLQRLWASEALVDYNHIRFPRYLPPDTKKKIEQAMVEVAKWPLFIVEESAISLSKLVAKARLLMRHEKVKLNVVDYVQLVSTAGKDERERLTKISHGLMALAKDSGVPVIELSQLSRPKEGNENQRPTIYNLKESGSIEQDADVVVLIYRPVDDRKLKTGEDELIVGKQRGGVTSVEKVRFTNFLRFKERHVQ